MTLQEVVRRNSRDLSWPGRLHLAIHILLPPGLLVIGALVIGAVRGNIPLNCDYSRAYLPAPWIVVVGVVGLVAGRYFSLLRPEPTQPRTGKGSAIVGQLAMAFLFLLLSGVWFYEAIGTAHVSVSATGTAEYEPITYYVRCAAYSDRASNGVGLYTIGVVFLVCALAGHWLWSYHPKLRDEYRESHTAALSLREERRMRGKEHRPGVKETSIT